MLVTDRLLPPPPIRELAPVATTEAPIETGNVSPFAGVIRALGREAERGEAMVRGVLRAAGTGQVLGPTELLALQAGIYRYGETIDLSAKLVDKAGTDVKTVLQGQ